MSEAKRAAVMKRGGERDHRDMFANRPADIGSVKRTLRPPPPDFGGVAARNETSVLFTVDALRGAARVKPLEPEVAPLSSAFLGSDEEGVIDLKALASTPPKVGARSVAPLFSEPAPATFTSDVSELSSSGVMTMPGGFQLRKRALYGIAAAAVALVLCSVGISAACKSEKPVARTTATMAPLPPVTAPPAPPPAPIPLINASASAGSDTSTDEEAKPVAQGKKGKKGKASFVSTKVRSGGVAPKAGKSSSEPLVSKPAPKAADKCGCKGDFNCILRCTAKGR